MFSSGQRPGTRPVPSASKASARSSRAISPISWSWMAISRSRRPSSTANCAIPHKPYRSISHAPPQGGAAKSQPDPGWLFALFSGRLMPPTAEKKNATAACSCVSAPPCGCCAVGRIAQNETFTSPESFSGLGMSLIPAGSPDQSKFSHLLNISGSVGAPRGFRSVIRTLPEEV